MVWVSLQKIPAGPELWFKLPQFPRLCVRPLTRLLSSAAVESVFKAPAKLRGGCDLSLLGCSLLFTGLKRDFDDCLRMITSLMVRSLLSLLFKYQFFVVWGNPFVMLAFVIPDSCFLLKFWLELSIAMLAFMFWFPKFKSYAELTYPWDTLRWPPRVLERLNVEEKKLTFGVRSHPYLICGLN